MEQDNRVSGIKDKLLYNYIVDQTRKKLLSNHERAVLLENYRKEHNLSKRQLAKDLGMSHSTVADWLRFLVYTPEVEQKLADKGINATTFYRIARDNPKVLDDHTSQELLLERIQECSELNRKLYVCEKHLADITLITSGVDEKTVQLVKDIDSHVRRIAFRVERFLKDHGRNTTNSGNV